MTTDFEALGSAIYSILGGTAGTCYYGIAPQDTSPPYTVFNRQDAVDEYTFTSNGVSSDYVLKAVSNRLWPSEAYGVYATKHALLQDGTISVTGYQALRCRRQTTLEYKDADGYWHVGGVYRIDIHGTA